MEAIPPVPPRILIVDDDDSVRDVISVLLREEGYNCVVASGAEMALDIAGQEETPLVISDMKMPGKDGLWLLEQLRERYPDTSVIMLTGYGDTESAVDCLRRGAVDYLLKPPKLTDLIRAIERALAKRRIELARKRYQKKLERKVRDRTTELRNALRDIAHTYQSTLLALVAALDAREHETSDHSQRVVSYTASIAQRLSISGKELEEIGRGALLHDIGKIGVPDAVLLKPGKLTPEEWQEMRKHPDIGFQMIQNIPFLATPAQIVLSHQERWDGQGYPRNLRGQEIHIGARIFAVADTLDAMTSDRPYRKGTTFANAITEIHRCAGTQFDRDVVRAFLDIGEQALIKIREDMQNRKLTLVQAEAQAQEAEATLARLTDDLDDIDQSIPGPGNPAPGTGPAPRGAASAPATPSPAPAVGAASTASRPEQPVVLSVLAGGRQGNTRD
ncbi:MAG TPA: HD domain-containing phosphohydrolase [Myxococcaceae bacterium]|nr:HD domain-containing phosphohydrolase [Myxococcaceae bacterium]